MEDFILTNEQIFSILEKYRNLAIEADKVSVSIRFEGEEFEEYTKYIDDDGDECCDYVVVEFFPAHNEIDYLFPADVDIDVYEYGEPVRALFRYRAGKVKYNNFNLYKHKSAEEIAAEEEKERTERLNNIVKGAFNSMQDSLTQIKEGMDQLLKTMESNAQEEVKSNESR